MFVVRGSEVPSLLDEVGAETQHGSAPLEKVGPYSLSEAFSSLPGSLCYGV